MPAAGRGMGRIEIASLRGMLADAADADVQAIG